MQHMSVLVFLSVFVLLLCQHWGTTSSLSPKNHSGVRGVYCVNAAFITWLQPLTVLCCCVGLAGPLTEEWIKGSRSSLPGSLAGAEVRGSSRSTLACCWQAHRSYLQLPRHPQTINTHCSTEQDSSATLWNLSGRDQNPAPGTDTAGCSGLERWLPCQPAQTYYQSHPLHLPEKQTIIHKDIYIYIPVRTRRSAYVKECPMN